MSMRSQATKYIEAWKCRGYSDDIPDEVPHRLMALGKAPSYKAIAIAILRNDIKELGGSLPVSAWYSEFKRVEIEARGGERQGRLF